jgi:hypothetical protein
VRRQADEIDAIKDHSPHVRLIDPAHQIQQCRFAGPVRTDDRGYFALPHAQRNVANRLHSAESLV